MRSGPMICEHCTTPIPDDSKFCFTCGADVSDPSGDLSGDVLINDTVAQELAAMLRAETHGEFKIHRELGRGGMAAVYLATEVHLGRQVAIKVLPPELTYGDRAIERFKREARTAANLAHPNIIPIYRVSSGGKLFWYAMQFLEGQALADLLEEKGQLSLDQTIDILRPVADALDYAHAQEVIHRDIKPANIMLDAHGRVIVTDFGIAKQISAGTLTASGSAIGTPYYMSPEQCRGLIVTGAADQYSTGIMAYQMLAGHIPFDSESAIDLLHQHCMTPPPPLAAERPDLPEHACRAVHQALAKRAEERFTSVTNFVGALEGDVTNLATTPTRARSSLAETVPLSQASADTVSRTAHVQPRPKRRGKVRALFAAIAIAAVGTLWLARSQLGDTLGAAPGDESAATSREAGRAMITVGSSPSSAVITINGIRLDGNPVVNHQVSSGDVTIQFEITDQMGIWTVDTTVAVSDGDTLNLGRIELVRPQ